MKNIKIITDCLVKGEHVAAGTKLRNVPPALATDLTTTGRAVEIEEAAEEIVTRDPSLVNRDPKPDRKAK